MIGNIIRFDHHETGEETSAIVVGETTDGNLRLKLHKDRTGERTWFCEPEEVKEVIGEVEDKENLRQMGRYSVQNAIEAAEEDGEGDNDETETIEDEETEEESETVEGKNIPAHPLKAWGEKHRRDSNEDVCSDCGDDMRRFEGEYVCPACLTRGNPDRYQRRQYMDIEELVERV